MSYDYLRQSLQTRPQRTAPFQAAPFVPRFVPQHHGTMASTPAHPSFFADEMYHHRDEQAAFEELAHQPVLHRPAAQAFPFRPLLPSADPLPLPMIPQPHVRKVGSLPTQAIPGAPGVLGGPVDRTQYSPVAAEDWSRASIDYDADVSSPGSDDTAGSPLTPVSDGSGCFTTHFFQQPGAATTTIGASYLAKQHTFNPYGTAMYAAAAPVAFAQPAPPVYHHHHQPRFFGTTDSMGGYQRFIAPAATQMIGLPSVQDDRRLLMPVQQPEPASFSDNSSDYDIREVDQTSEAEEEMGSDVEEEHSASSRSSVVEVIDAARERDNFLLEKRKEGMPYREIRRLGGFREAESTLRGRVRVLTKDKSERVRRPEWTADDVSTRW